MLYEFRKPRPLYLNEEVIYSEDDTVHISQVKNNVIAFRQNNKIKNRKIVVLDRIHKLQKEIYALLEELKELGGR